jgi:hypothetical protein
MDHLLAKISALIAKKEQHRMEEAGEQLIKGLSPWTRVEADKDKLAELRLAARNRSIDWLTYSNPEGDTGERAVEP